MFSGQCLCGSLRFIISGDPIAQVGSALDNPPKLCSQKTDILKALCHCLDCRRISGSYCALNWVVPVDQLVLTSGVPREFSNTADSGASVTSHFCGNCGSTLWRDGPASQGLLYLKAGSINEISEVDARSPVAEIFVKRRAAWVKPIEGAQQKEGLF